MSVSIEKVTSDIAAKWLETNSEYQRDVKPHGLNSLVTTMREGRYMVNGESIIFDWNGRLIDGQHRLMAIIEAGICTEAVVVRGVNPDAYKTIDNTGAGSRSSADLFAIQKEVNACLMSAILRLIIAYVEYGRWPGQQIPVSAGKMAPDKIVNALESYPTVREIASIATAHRTKAIPPAYVGFLIWCVGEGYRKDVLAFLRRIMDGLGLDQTSPEYHYRKRIIDNAARTKTTPKNIVWSLLSKCWNASARGQRMASLRPHYVGEEMYLVTDRGTERSYMCNGISQ